MKKLLIIATCLLTLSLVACGKKADEAPKTDNAAAAPAVPADPAIDAKDLIGTWKGTFDDPNIYTFMEDGKCKGKELTDNAPRDCTYEIKTPDKTGKRFNTLVMNYPASGDNEEYSTERFIRVSGDQFDFIDNEGNTSEFNHYKKFDPNAAPAKDEKAEDAPAYAGNIQEDILGEWSEEVSEGPTVTYKFLKDGKCWFQDVMNEKGVDCTYKITPDTGNKFKLVVTREDILGGMKDYDNIIEFKDGNLFFYLDNHPYKYNKK